MLGMDAGCGGVQHRRRRRRDGGDRQPLVSGPPDVSIRQSTARHRPRLERLVTETANVGSFQRASSTLARRSSGRQTRRSGSHWVALVVDERRAVDAAHVQPGGHRHRRRRGRVPLVHAAVVQVDVGVAEHDRHRLGAGRAESNRRRQPSALATIDRRVRRPGARGDEARPLAVDGGHDRRGIGGRARGRSPAARPPRRRNGRDPTTRRARPSRDGPVAVLARPVERVDDPHPVGLEASRVLRALLVEHGVVGADAPAARRR